MSQYTFANTQAGYRKRWSDMAPNAADKARITNAAKLVLKGKARYEAVSEATGVPWAVIGVWHYRESACDFRGVLHNGEKIIGTGRKTKLVPAGRGPFATWEEAARDALALKGLKPGVPAWSVEMFLYQSERFNGFGYRMRNTPSAYLWSGTNQYRSGKFVADHKYDPKAIDKQLGVAPLMARLMELDTSVTFIRVVVTEVEKPATAAPVKTLDKEAIRQIQQTLVDKGFYEVGRVDGLWGPRTFKTLAAFQVGAGLPVTVQEKVAHVDDATISALMRAAPVTVAESRATTTAASLRRHGDEATRAILRGKWLTGGLGGAAVVTSVVQWIGEATDYIAPVKALLSGVSDAVWLAIIAVLAVALWLSMQSAESAVVESVRTGRDAGPA